MFVDMEGLNRCDSAMLLPSFIMVSSIDWVQETEYWSKYKIVSLGIDRCVG